MSKPAWAVGARQGPIRRHKQVVWFACEGLIAIYDERTHDEDYLVVTPTDFAARAKGLGEMGQKMAKGDQKWMRTEGQAMRAAANEMLESVKEARAMGDPSDPAVQAYWARHRSNSTVRISLSAGSDPEGYPDLPEVPLGKFTGRTAEPGESLAGAVQLADDNRIRKKPKKKKQGLILSSDVL